MTSIALVLGAGGVIGAAYDIGALAALADATGWDARDADLVVGTSAGAGVAASLRLGLAPDDLYRRAQDLPMSDQARALLGELPLERVRLPERPPLDPLAFLSPTAPWLVVPALLARGAPRFTLFGCLFPRGRVSTEVLGDRVRALSTGRWPEQPTWIVATRLRDGRRVVFGRDDVDVADLGLAVQASSAAPGHFEPVTVDRSTYFDGATYSTTNADLPAGLGYDLVVVVSPMSATRAAQGRLPSLTTRTEASRALAREVRAVRDGGTPVLVLQPTAEDLPHLRAGALEHERSAPISRQAFASVRAHLDDPAVADRLALLHPKPANGSVPRIPSPDAPLEPIRRSARGADEPGSPGLGRG